MPPRKTAAQAKLVTVVHRASRAYAKLPASSKATWQGTLKKEWAHERAKHKGKGK